MSLPQPREDTSLVLRTDFSDEAAWDALRAAIDAQDEHGEATYVGDAAYDGATVQSLIDADRGPRRRPSSISSRLACWPVGSRSATS
ncbi:DUF6924 domain-containing protein [Catenulispora subtropica]|uniref:DUF6924 domain-containing protein n=1 Tax=Catenulispora subtropica TaxID=450798 RepID=UPI003CD0A300